MIAFLNLIFGLLWSVYYFGTSDTSSFKIVPVLLSVSHTASALYLLSNKKKYNVWIHMMNVIMLLIYLPFAIVLAVKLMNGSMSADAKGSYGNIIILLSMWWGGIILTFVTIRRFGALKPAKMSDYPTTAFSYLLFRIKGIFIGRK